MSTHLVTTKALKEMIADATSHGQTSSFTTSVVDMLSKKERHEITLLSMNPAPAGWGISIVKAFNTEGDIAVEVLATRWDKGSENNA